MSRLFSILFVLLFLSPVFAQHNDGVVARAIIFEGDTIPIIGLAEVKIFGPVIFKSKHDAIRFSKLMKNVKKVYPYARVVSIKVKEYNDLIANATNEREKKRLMKEAEKNLKAEFEDDIKDMTFAQGEILIKLIDRETGTTSYDLIKEFRGRIVAIFWGSLGKLFGFDLKSTYDPQGADKDIEQIVIMIENGAL
jgi:hypothetical protein